jgi:putative ATP-dependent endonuclease of OLD family
VHQISRLSVINFKSIRNGDFPLSPYTPLVGYNNAGKTNILSAISWAIQKSSLLSPDFFDPSTALSVTVEISGITADVLDALGESHRKRIEPIVRDGRFTLKRTQLKPAAKATDIRLEVQKTDELGNISWEVNPTGIDAALLQLFPDPIFIGAMENATEDVGKFGAGTTIGKLIKEMIDPVVETNTELVSEALAEITKKLSAKSEEKDENLVELDMQIQSELSAVFPGVSAKIHIPTPQFTDFLKGATIKLFEDEYAHPEGRDASSFGHGAQRSVQIALIKCLAQIRRSKSAAKGRTTLLLIDEPELYLHPQAIETVRLSLTRLATEGYQVIFSTHSANMIARHDAHNALLIRKNNAVGTRAYPRIKDAVQSAIESADYQSETLFALTNSAQVLFNEKVILAEGKTEKAIVPELFHQETGSTLTEAKLGLVDLGGSPNVPNAMKVLRAMGVPTKAIVDLDFAFHIAPREGLLQEDHPSLTECKKIIRSLSDAGHFSLDARGLPTSADGVTAAKAFEILSNKPDAIPHLKNIHDLLLAEGIWCWPKGTIESHLGLANKKSPEHLRFLKNLGDEAFQFALPDYKAAVETANWLKS